jgi:hypothetical protein
VDGIHLWMEIIRIHSQLLAFDNDQFLHELGFDGSRDKSGSERISTNRSVERKGELHDLDDNAIRFQF